MSLYCLETFEVIADWSSRTSQMHVINSLCKNEHLSIFHKHNKHNSSFPQNNVDCRSLLICETKQRFVIMITISEPCTIFFYYRRMYTHLTLRECYYLAVIKKKNLKLYRDIIERLKAGRLNDGDQNASLAIDVSCRFYETSS